MGRKNGFITGPVNTSDVATTLSISTHDEGAQCRSIKINKWSLRKPVKYQKLGKLTEAEFQSVDYGLQPVVIDNANPGLVMNLVNHVNTNQGVDWAYIRPTGGAASPYRISDFIGYQHNRQPWFNLQLGVEQGSYAYVAQGSSIQIQQDADIDIGWLQKNLATFKAISPTLACNAVVIYKQGMSKTTDPHVICAYRMLYRLNGKSNFEVGIPSTLATGNYVVIPVIATFGSAGAVPAKLADLTDTTGTYNYVFFQGGVDNATINPPSFNISRITNIYPLPCTPGLIKVFAPNETPTNTSAYFVAQLLNTAGQYGITTVSSTLNGVETWMVKLWGKIQVSMRTGASAGLAQTVTVTLKVPNWVQTTGYSGTALSKDDSGQPYKAMVVTKTAPGVWDIPSSNPLTFHLPKDNFNYYDYGWYDYDADNNPIFKCAYIPYIMRAQSGTPLNMSFSVLD